MAKNPNFEALVAAAPASFAADFKLRPMPKISDSLKQGVQFAQALAAHDQAMALWTQDAERSINERITQATNQPLGKTAAAASGSGSSSGSGTSGTPSVTGVTSVNGKTGAVSLETDDIPEGPTDKYLTQAGWLTLFDHNGFVRNNVPPADTVFVPSGRVLVMAGPFNIMGTLNVTGLIVFLPVP